MATPTSTKGGLGPHGVSLRTGELGSVTKIGVSHVTRLKRAAFRDRLVLYEGIS